MSLPQKINISNTSDAILCYPRRSVNKNVEQSPIAKGFIEPLPIIREQLSVIQQRVLHYFLEANQSIEQLSMAQTTIALKLNCSVRSVGRAIKRLVDLGLIYYWQRPYDTNLYMIEDILLEPATLQQLRILFRNIFLFSISFLLSRDNVRPLILDVNILSKCNEQTISPTPRTNKEVLYLPQVVWLYDLKLEGEPNKKKTLEEFEALFTPWDLNMLSFTTEQQQQLEQYSQSTRDYAHKIFTKDMASGKAISNQFAYFNSICRNHAAKNQTPQKGSAQPIVKEQVPDGEYIDKLALIRHAVRVDAEKHGIPSTFGHETKRQLLNAMKVKNEHYDKKALLKYKNPPAPYEEETYERVNDMIDWRQFLSPILKRRLDGEASGQSVPKRHELKEEAVSNVSDVLVSDNYAHMLPFEAPFLSDDSVWEEV